MATDGDIISLIDFDRRWLSRLLRTVNLTHRTREIEFTYGELLES